MCLILHGMDMVWAIPVTLWIPGVFHRLGDAFHSTPLGTHQAELEETLKTATGPANPQEAACSSGFIPEQYQFQTL